jgi:ligand-binding sensor domain-containing protein
VKKIVFILIFIFYLSPLHGINLDINRWKDGIALPLLDNFITSISSANDMLFVGCWDGLFVCNMKSMRWKSGSDYRGEFPVFITSIFAQSSNEVYIGTSYYDGAGLYLLKDGVISKIVIDDNKLNITALYMSKGILFVGTFGHGLYCRNSEGFRKVKIKGRYITDIDGIENEIYIATKYNGIFKLTPNSTEVIDEHSSNLPNNSVSTICCRNKNEIWCGSWGGASRIKGGKWTTFFKYENQLLNNNAKTICCDNDFVYIGTDKGISIIDKNNTFLNISSDKYPLPSDNILALHRAGKYLWVGTDKGMIKIGTSK